MRVQIWVDRDIVPVGDASYPYWAVLVCLIGYLGEEKLQPLEVRETQTFRWVKYKHDVGLGQAATFGKRKECVW